MTAYYSGMPLGARELSLTFDVAATFRDEDFTAYRVSPMGEREVRLTLAHGQRVPDSLKKGRPVLWLIQGSRFVGRVKFRRLNVVVAEGHFE